MSAKRAADRRVDLAVCLSLILLALTPAPAEAKDWNAVRRIDPFTDNRSCRVEQGGSFTRGMQRQLSGFYFGYYFFAEKRNEEIRAGVFSEPALPIHGDVQIRVDDHVLTTITATDTPLDAAPAMPPVAALDALPAEQRAALETQMRATLAIASPYRALTGIRAATLIEEILAGKIVIARTIGINAATSTIGEWKPNKDLLKALVECEIVGPDGKVISASAASSPQN